MDASLSRNPATVRLLLEQSQLLHRRSIEAIEHAARILGLDDDDASDFRVEVLNGDTDVDERWPAIASEFGLPAELFSLQPGECLPAGELAGV